MTTDAVLILAQWLSPGYPVGAFAYSHGLEAAVEMGAVQTGTLETWLDDVMRQGAGQADVRLLAAAWRAGDAEELAGVDATARAFAATRERLLETDRQGGAFGAVTGAVWAADVAGLTYPVAVGRAARLEGLPLELTARMYLQAMLANLVAAAQRLLPLGQTEAQAILRRLSAATGDVVAEALEGGLERLHSNAFLGDIAAMRHETQPMRIFRT